METTTLVIKCDGCHEIIDNFYETENRVEIKGQFSVTTTGKPDKNGANTKKVYEHYSGVNLNFCNRDCLISFFKI